ncbi:hypothetical protein BBUWI9123_F0010 (plasmid) [Borreliella burgdorferi WI91-23]|nr:hypothetical protein BBUWI9123_F0010 [Borreliella burgdorferi WI91-23]
MQKYLYKLVKELKITNNYYKLNCFKKEYCLKLNNALKK